MEKIRKVLRPGGDKDDEIMYGTPSKVSEQPPQLSTDEGKEKDSGGILRQVLNPGGEKYSEQSYGTTAHATEDTQKASNLHGASAQEGTTATSSAAPGTRLSSLLQEDQDRASVLSLKSGKEGPYAQGADTPVVEQSGLSFAGAGATAGGATAAGAAAHEGIVRQDKGDDVSQATYTARSYPLTDSSIAPTSSEPVVDSSEDRREPEEISSTTRDTSLAGAGTLIGAGAVSAGALAAQEDKHNADDVNQATYTYSAYQVGSSSNPQEGVTPISANAQDIRDPSKLDSANRLAPHVPGEFPTEDGEDPHVPGEFPAAPGEKEQYGIGTGSAIAGAMGLTVGGAAAGAAYAATRGNDDKDWPESPRDVGRDHAKNLSIRAPGSPEVNSSRPPEAAQEWPESPRDVGRDHARNLSIREPGSPEVNSSRPPEAKSDGNKGVIGAAAAAVGLGGAGTYLATRGDDEKQWPEPPQDVGRGHARNLSIKEPGSPEKNPSRPAESTKTSEVVVPQQATKDDIAKEEESHTGRNAALAAGGVGAAGAAAYYATRDDKQEPPRNDPAREQAKNLTTKAPGTEEKNPSTVPVPQQATKDDVAQQEGKKDDSHLGRDAAIGGGAAAAAGGAAYYATREDEQPQQAEEKKSAIEKAKEKVTGGDDKKAEKEHEKEVEKARKEQEKQQKEREKELEKQQKEREKEEEKRRKEAEKEAEKRTKEEEKHLSKDEKKEEEQRKKEEWEKLNMERLAAYNRGELGPEDVLRDRQKAIADNPEEGPTTAEEAVLAGGAGATAAAVARGEDVPHRESLDSQGDKKPSLIQKILHPRKSRQEEKERRASAEASRSSQDSHPHARHVGTDGPIGNDSKVSGVESSSSAKDTTSTSRAGDDEIQPVQSGSSQPSAHMLEAGEQAPEGYITIHHAGASDDAPHLVVQDK